jgi:hypothetical protein
MCQSICVPIVSFDPMQSNDIESIDKDDVGSNQKHTIPENAVGKHPGVFFNHKKPTNRTGSISTTTTCYFPIIDAAATDGECRALSLNPMSLS